MLSHMRPSLSLAVAAAALLLAAGCGGDEKPEATPSSAFPTPDSATVEGRLLAVGGPAPGDPRPMKRGTITLTGPDGSRISGQVDAEGHFAIGVTPGTYRVVGRSKDFNAGGADCLPKKRTVALEKGSNTTVDLYCSMM